MDVRRGEAPYKNTALVVSRELADAAIRTLHKARLLDPTRHIRTDAEVIIPVRPSAELEAWAARVGGRLIEAPDLEPRTERPTPYGRVLEHLSLPADLLDAVPDRWEKLGDVVVIRLPDSLRPHAAEVAEAFAAGLGCRCVIHDPAGVIGELRQMQGEILWGSDPVTLHIENGVRYRFDASRIMFSSGNVHERKRAAAIRAPGETIVDMFAGIGYFTLPLALHSGAARIVALEKNPVSFSYLQENLAINGVTDIVTPWQGDNREYPEEGIADRVWMGYFPGTAAFLPKALRLLRPEGGIVHYHDTGAADDWREELLGALQCHAHSVEVLEAREVKSHSPGVVHAVIVARVRR